MIGSQLGKSPGVLFCTEIVLKRGLEFFSTLIVAEGSEPILAKLCMHMMVQETFQAIPSINQTMLFTILFTREAMESAMATVATARAMGDAATPKQVEIKMMSLVLDLAHHFLLLT